MSHTSNFSHVGLAATLLLGFFLLAGCRRKEPAATSPGHSVPTNLPAGVSAASPSVIPTNFSVPFQGVIQSREQRDLILNSAEITYTIGQGKIRREAVRTDPLSKLADLGRDAAGVICDLQAERVVLYRRGQPGRLFVRMTLAEYRQLIAGESKAAPETSAVQLAPVTVKPDFGEHVGTFFSDIPRPIPAGHAVNLPEARMARGLPCDQLTIQMGDTVFEVWHSQRIKVDKRLLELVELRLPAEVTGFPCFMRRLQLIEVPPANQSASKGQQLLQRGAEWAARMAEKALKREVKLLQITESLPADSAFTLDETFREVSTLDELHRLFQPAQGHHDWD